MVDVVAVMHGSQGPVVAVGFLVGTCPRSSPVPGRDALRLDFTGLRSLCLSHRLGPSGHTTGAAAVVVVVWNTRSRSRSRSGLVPRHIPTTAGADFTYHPGPRARVRVLRREVFGREARPGWSQPGVDEGSVGVEGYGGGGGGGGGCGCEIPTEPRGRVDEQVRALTRPPASLRYVNPRFSSSVAAVAVGVGADGDAADANGGVEVVGKEREVLERGREGGVAGVGSDLGGAQETRAVPGGETGLGLGEGNVWGMEEGVRATGAKHISARGRRGGGRERRSDPGTLPLPSVRMYCRVLKKKRMREEYVNGGRSVGRVMAF